MDLETFVGVRLAYEYSSRNKARDDSVEHVVSVTINGNKFVTDRSGSREEMEELASLMNDRMVVVDYENPPKPLSFNFLVAVCLRETNFSLAGIFDALESFFSKGNMKTCRSKSRLFSCFSFQV